MFLTRETPNLSRKRVFHGKRYEHIAAKDFEITSHKIAAIFRAHSTVFPLQHIESCMFFLKNQISEQDDNDIIYLFLASVLKTGG